MIPYGKQEIVAEDIEAVLSVLKSDFITQGPVVPGFEHDLGEYLNVPEVVAMNSATSALHCACLALGLGKGDLLWTSPISFVASANCAIYCGADIDFVDIDYETHNMSPIELRRKLEGARSKGRLPKVVVPVHMGGLSCDMQTIYELSLEFGFKIIEDASHAIGGRYRGSLVGSCKYSHITVFSFHPVKIITTGEGGAATTRDADLCERLRSFRSHGITRDVDLIDEPDRGAWFYEQRTLGYNYRMTELQAALGRSQLKRLDSFVTRRNELASRYSRKLADVSVALPYSDSLSWSAYHLYVVKLKEGGAAARKKLFHHMRESGIGVNVHYIPIHLQPFYQQRGFSKGDFPEAERYYDNAVTIPLYPGLRRDDQDFIVRIISSFLE